jgi:Flp pilus assembly protein TadG
MGTSELDPRGQFLAKGWARCLRHAEGGVATTELALLLPFFLTLMFGGIEIAHLLYVKTVLRGEIERAARSSSLETAPMNTAAIDARVESVVRRITPGATIDFERRAYRSYANALSKAEPFTDGNGDGLCNNGETYTDMNANGSWDADGGVSGIGDARQIVAYDIKVRFPPLFPFMEKILGINSFTLLATTQLRNQPYAGTSTPETRICP